MEGTIYISSGVIIAVFSFLIRWIFTQFDKKIDLIFNKLDDMVKQSELDKLKNLIDLEINKKEDRFKEVEKRIREIEQTQDRCKSCKQ